jgi:endo-alpha-1,4-polygalactosaminidase (GH114 family)
MKEELKKEWREQLEDLIAKYKTDISDGGYFDLVDGYIPLESFISSLLAKQQEEFVKIVEEMETTNGVTGSDHYQIGQNHGRQEFKRKLLDVLADIKSKLNI